MFQLTRAFRLEQYAGKPLLCLVGGGGKTTTMFMLADELAAQGKRVVTTTTTRLFATQRAQSPAWCALDDLGALGPLLDAHGQCLVTAAGAGWEEAGAKAQGIPVEAVEALLAREDVDAVLVEADGSRARPFKAPAPQEPVIPPTATHVVALVGADIFGKPLAAEQVHRPERVAALGGVAEGVPVTPDLVARVLLHPAGGLQGVPEGARFLPFLNRIESEADAMGAEEAAARLLESSRVSEVLLGSLHALREQSQEPNVYAHSPLPNPESLLSTLYFPLSRRSRPAAIILAAGMASRFGRAKQLLEWRGRALVTHVAEAALECCDTVLVVVGHEAEAVARAVEHLPVEAIWNEQYAAGQGSSVAAGVAALVEASRPFIGEAFFLLADQPLVSGALLERLRQQRGLHPIAVPRYRGKRGNPVLFDAALFPELRSARGDEGGRALFEAYADDIAWIDVDDEAILLDVDTPAQWEALRKR